MMDKKGLELSETVCTRLDRKAGAIVELTMRHSGTESPHG